MLQSQHIGEKLQLNHQMFSIKIMLRYQLLPFKNCRHWADFIILEMLWWRFWKRQSGEFCIGCNWIPCFCIRYRNAAITEHGSLSRDAMFCSSRIVHPYRRNQPWFQVYTSVCPRGARREKGPLASAHRLRNLWKSTVAWAWTYFLDETCRDVSRNVRLVQHCS